MHRTIRAIEPVRSATLEHRKGETGGIRLKLSFNFEQSNTDIILIQQHARVNKLQSAENVLPISG